MVENGVLFYETGKHIRRGVLFVVKEYQNEQNGIIAYN